MTAPAFEPVHHVILNCAAFVCLQVHGNDDRLELVLRRLGGALNEAPRGSAIQARLCDIAAPLVAAAADRRGLAWAHARLTASTNLANLFFWRAGLADAAAKGDAEDAA